ncbi:MAG TPA: class I SAM-dependent methyltransferase [Pseudomonadales bacterium]|nr:class I SAM-dependent methyltransferase [Pseudomonadales bacterium]
MWDERYNTEEYVYGTEPNAFLTRHVDRIRGAKVLCLGEGEGRNAVFLATKGFQVTAVDLSQAGLNKAEKLASLHGVHINCIRADLADFQLGSEDWDAIVSIFCHLPPAPRKHLYQQIGSALKRGGVFLLEAYTPDQLKFDSGGPNEASMLLSAEQLQADINGVEFELLQELERDVTEGKFHTGHAAVLQAIAVKPVRAYQVSANREAGKHKMRFVETGGGEADPNCRVCQPVTKPRDEN